VFSSIVKLHNLYSTPNIVRQIKSRRMMLAGQVARKGQERKCTTFWWENLEERDHSEDQGVDGRMRSECILGRLATGGWS
jgi:hypothetical protein